jgi:hypothetical protein
MLHKPVVAVIAALERALTVSCAIPEDDTNAFGPNRPNIWSTLRRAIPTSEAIRATSSSRSFTIPRTSNLQTSGRIVAMSEEDAHAYLMKKCLSMMILIIIQQSFTGGLVHRRWRFASLQTKYAEYGINKVLSTMRSGSSPSCQQPPFDHARCGVRPTPCRSAPPRRCRRGCGGLLRRPRRCGGRLSPHSRCGG